MDTRGSEEAADVTPRRPGGYLMDPSAIPAEPRYDRFGPEGFRFPPYYRSPSECGKGYIYRGKSAHVWVGEQVDEFTAIVIELLTTDFCDDTNSVDETMPKPFTEAQAAMWDRLDRLSQAVADLLDAYNLTEGSM